MKATSLILGLLLAMCAATSQAGAYSDQLTTCLTDNTSGKDRKLLAKWVFSAMAAHPEMRSMANIPNETREDTLRAAGAMLTRLLTETCVAQTQAALKNEGGMALETSFAVLGQLAMRELMSNPDVNAAIGSIDQFVDRKKMNAVMNSK